MSRALLLCGILLFAFGLSGCAVVTVASATVAVAATVVEVGATAVGTAVDVVIPDDEDDEDD